VFLLHLQIQSPSATRQVSDLSRFPCYPQTVYGQLWDRLCPPLQHLSFAQRTNLQQKELSPLRGDPRLSWEWEGCTRERSCKALKREVYYSLVYSSLRPLSLKHPPHPLLTFPFSHHFLVFYRLSKQSPNRSVARPYLNDIATTLFWDHLTTVRCNPWCQNQRGENGRYPSYKKLTLLVVGIE